MKLSKLNKVIAQLEAEKADAQKRCAADVAVLDLAIKKLHAHQTAKPTRRVKELPKPMATRSAVVVEATKQETQ